MSKLRIAAITIAGLGLGGVALGAFWQGVALKFTSKAAIYDFSSGTPTDEQRRQAAIAIHNGDPLPSGWTLVSMEGDIQANPTGLSDLNGNKQYRVILKDETSDLNIARLYKDGALVNTATRANGKITDTAGIATATLLFYTPLTGSHLYELKWESSGGVERVARVNVP
jgi:hypothetical protein